VWHKNVGTSFFGFVTEHTFDRQTDGQTDRQTDRRTDGQKGIRNIVRCITCSLTVKIKSCEQPGINLQGTA